MRVTVTDIRGDIYKPLTLFHSIRGIFLNAMAFCDGDQGRAARHLGVSTRMMTYSLKKYDIPRVGKGH